MSLRTPPGHSNPRIPADPRPAAPGALRVREAPRQNPPITGKPQADREHRGGGEGDEPQHGGEAKEWPRYTKPPVRLVPEDLGRVVRLEPAQRCTVCGNYVDVARVVEPRDGEYRYACLPCAKRFERPVGSAEATEGS